LGISDAAESIGMHTMGELMKLFEDDNQLGKDLAKLNVNI